MEQKSFQVINTANCKYVYLTDQKKLMSMGPMETVYDLETGEANQQFDLGGEGRLTQIPLDSQFYVNEQSFKAGNRIPTEYAIETCTLVNIMEQLFRSFYVKEDNVGPFVWTYENGEATKWRLEEHTKRVFIDYNNRQNNRIDGQLPRDIYESAEEVYMYNDYTVQDKDGLDEVREGVYRRLFMTDEQNALVDELQAVINKCIKAGVALDMDLAVYEVKAFNAANIKEYGYEPVYDEDNGERSYQLLLDKAGRTIKGIGDINTEGGDVYFVISKSGKEA